MPAEIRRQRTNHTNNTATNPQTHAASKNRRKAREECLRSSLRTCLLREGLAYLLDHKGESVTSVAAEPRDHAMRLPRLVRREKGTRNFNDAASHSQ